MQTRKACLEPEALAEQLGPENPDVASSLARLAGRYVDLERYTEAEPLYQRALAIREKALESDHVEVATTLEGYAVLLRKTARGADADEMDARAQAIRGHQSTEATPVDRQRAECRWECQ